MLNFPFKDLSPRRLKAMPGSILCWLRQSKLGRAKIGGERGIRTLDAPFRAYTISNRAPSTTQTPLPVIIQRTLITKYSLLTIGSCTSRGRWSSSTRPLAMTTTSRRPLAWRTSVFIGRLRELYHTSCWQRFFNVIFESGNF
jgi:hypothetical protein